MTAVGIGQLGSQAISPGSSPCRAKYIYDFTDICQKFHSDGSHCTVGRTILFCSGTSGFKSLSCQMFFFMISLTFVSNSNGSHGSVSKTTGFWCVRYGFESQPLPTFFNISITTENRDTTPLLCMKRFDARIFLKPGRVPLRSFSVLWDKKIPTENRDLPLLCLKFFDTRNFLNYWRVPLRNF